MESVPRAAVVGGLAGVNFFPLDSNPIGLGVVKTPREVYQRIDVALDPQLQEKVVEVDAVMRGPLVFRKKLLEKYGYLDEAYCPFFNDDMDYCFKMKKLGFSIFYFPMDVENKNLTIANYSEEKNKFWQKTVLENQKLFYNRWQDYFGKHDHYLVLPKSFSSRGSRTIKRKIVVNLVSVVNYLINMKTSPKIILKKILIKLPLNLKLFFVKRFAQASSLFRKISFNIQIYGVQPRVAAWYAVDGDEVLRLNYDLNADSIVLDVGGYEGEWAGKIFCKYGCIIHVFEPVDKFYEEIKGKFTKNNKVFVHNFGLGNKDEEVSFGVDGNASSEFIGSDDHFEKVQLRSVVEIFKENDIKVVDLMKINIEGGEYDVLEALINAGLISKILNIQVQFHDFVPDAQARMKKIHEKLKLTHQLTYHYEFVWENWKLKK
jgi:FkbM family methyltransferase